MYINMNLRSEDYSPKLVYFRYFGFSCLLAFGKTSKHTGTAVLSSLQQAQG